MIHAHIMTWLVALILFVVALFMNKSGKGFKIIVMILRLFYLLIIATGAMLLTQVYHIDWKYILKVVMGLWVIGLFEMILSRVSKNRRTSVFWIQFIVAFSLVLYLGFVVLPMSFLHP